MPAPLPPTPARPRDVALAVVAPAPGALCLTTALFLRSSRPWDATLFLSLRAIHPPEGHATLVRGLQGALALTAYLLASLLWRQVDLGDGLDLASVGWLLAAGASFVAMVGLLVACAGDLLNPDGDFRRHAAVGLRRLATEVEGRTRGR